MMMKKRTQPFYYSHKLVLINGYISDYRHTKYWGSICMCGATQLSLS